MKLNKAKRKYPGQWLALRVLRPPREGEDPEGKVLAHARNRQGLHDLLEKQHVKDACLTYAGPVLKSGYTTLFLCKHR